MNHTPELKATVYRILFFALLSVTLLIFTLLFLCSYICPPLCLTVHSVSTQHKGIDAELRDTSLQACISLGILQVIVHLMN